MAAASPLAPAAAAAANTSTQRCEAANAQARFEHPEYKRGRYLTKAVMCDVTPHCATEAIFSQELWWRTPSGNGKLPPSSDGLPVHDPVSRCRTWRNDADWPTHEPYISRATQQPRVRPFWDLLRLLPNRTVWLHGDSITLQMCNAALCSLMRSGVASTPVLGGKHSPLWLRKLSADTTYNFMSTLLPNGARLLCSDLGVFQRPNVERVLQHVDVAILNFGLHYHDAEAFGAVLREVLSTFQAWRRGAKRPGDRLALWREGSAQHFRGTGSYTPGAERRQVDAKSAPGAPCHCAPLGDSVPPGNNLNMLGWKLEHELAPAHDVLLVPFFNLTAPRHDMHRGHYCAFDRQTSPGRCCDW